MSRRNTEVTVDVKPDGNPGPDAVEASARARVEETCPMVEVLGRVSAKWNISILVAVSEGPVRFTELERALVGISRRMLTLNLRNLERDGLVIRTVYPTVPPRSSTRRRRWRASCTGRCWR